MRVSGSLDRQFEVVQQGLQHVHLDVATGLASLLSLPCCRARAVDNLIALQGAADDSHNKAAARSSHFGRRVLLFGILWLVALAPLVGALANVPVFVEDERAPWDVLGIFTGGWEQLNGIILIDEVRAGFTACVGYWLGGAAVGRRR